EEPRDHGSPALAGTRCQKPNHGDFRRLLPEARSEPATGEEAQAGQGEAALQELAPVLAAMEAGHESPFRWPPLWPAGRPPVNPAGKVAPPHHWRFHWPAALSFAITRSLRKLAALCRSGNSLKLSSQCLRPALAPGGFQKLP